MCRCVASCSCSRFCISPSAPSPRSASRSDCRTPNTNSRFASDPLWASCSARTPGGAVAGCRSPNRSIASDSPRETRFPSLSLEKRPNLTGRRTAGLATLHSPAGARGEAIRWTLHSKVRWFGFEGACFGFAKIQHGKWLGLNLGEFLRFRSPNRDDGSALEHRERRRGSGSPREINKWWSSPLLRDRKKEGARRPLTVTISTGRWMELPLPCRI